jgi:seryl-tRNA synthetase
MAGIRINNRQRPTEVDGIDDRDIRRQMAAWADAFGKVETELKAVFVKVDALIRQNRELNQAVGRKLNDRSGDGDKKKALEDLLARTSATHNALERLIGP